MKATVNLGLKLILSILVNSRILMRKVVVHFYISDPERNDFKKKKKGTIFS